MADFKKSFAKTAIFEGGYANDPDDLGGETYKGIARNMWPQWAGWKIIDRYDSSPLSSRQLDEVLHGSVELEGLVEDFYRAHFWKPIMGDSIMNQLVADNIYDFAVNSGVSRAVRYAQRIVGTIEDGIMGSKTIKAINQNTHDFVGHYKAARLGFVQKIVANNPTQKKFLNGWMQRILNA